MLGPCPSPFLALVRGYMVAALSSSFLSVRVVVLLGSLLPVAMFVVLMPQAISLPELASLQHRGLLSAVAGVWGRRRRRRRGKQL